jgi:autotransporter-associated beta strand protein
MLSLQDVTFSGDAVAGGRATGDSSGHAGSAIGQALFLGNDVTYTVANGKTITLADSIGGGNDPEARGGLTVKGNGTLVLAAADNSYVGDTIVQSGTLRVSGSIAASRGVTTNAGATFDAAATQRVASLTLNSGGQAKVSAGVLVVGDNAQAKPLTVAGDGSGRLDVGSNGLVLDHSPGNDAADLLYARSLVTQGYNGGHWRGNGITSGSAGGDSTKAVGYAPAEAALPFANGAGTDTFLGTVVDRSSILLRYTLAGDANLDGMVDFQDLVRLAQSYNMDASSSADGPWAHGDSTYDGKVDFADLVRLAQNYNGSLPAGPIAGVPADFESDLVLAEASVPEPLSTEMICAVGIWGCVIRRRGPASGGGLARAGSEFTL